MAGHSKPIIRTDTTVLTEDLQRLNDLLSRDIDDILAGLSDKQNTVCAGLDVEFDYQTNEATIFNGCGVVATSNSLELSQYIDVSKVHFLNLRRLQGDELRATINPTDYPITQTNQYVLLCLKNNNVWSESSANAASEAEVASSESSDIKRTIMVWDPSSLGLNPVFNKSVCVHNEPTYDLRLISVDLSKVIYEDLNAAPLSNIAKAIIECKDNYSFIDTSVDKDTVLELAVFQLVNGMIVRYEPCQRRLGKVCLTDIATQGGVFSKKGFFTSGQCVFGDMQSKSASFDDLKIQTITNSRAWDTVSGSFGGSTFYLGMPVYGGDGSLQFPDNTISPLTVVNEFSLVNSADPTAIKALYYNGVTNQIDVNANINITSTALIKTLEVLNSIYSTDRKFSVVERNGKAVVIVDGDIEVTGGIFQGSASASASFDSVVSKKFVVNDGAEYATISRLGFVAPSLAAEFHSIQARSGVSVIAEGKFFKTGNTNQLDPNTILNDSGISDGLFICPHIGAYNFTAHSIKTSVDGYAGNITTADLYVKKNIEAAGADLFINSIKVSGNVAGISYTGHLTARSCAVDNGSCGTFEFRQSTDTGLNNFQPQQTSSGANLTTKMDVFGANKGKIYELETHGKISILDSNKVERITIENQTVSAPTVKATSVVYTHQQREQIKFFPAHILRPVDSKRGFDVVDATYQTGLDRSSRLITPCVRRETDRSCPGGSFERKDVSFYLQPSLSVNIVASSYLWIPDHDIGYSTYGNYGFVLDMNEFVGQFISRVWVVTDSGHHRAISESRSWPYIVWDRYPDSFACTIFKGINQNANWTYGGYHQSDDYRSVQFTPSVSYGGTSVIVSSADPCLHVRVDHAALHMNVDTDFADGFQSNGGSAIVGVFVQFNAADVDLMKSVTSRYCRQI